MQFSFLRYEAISYDKTKDDTAHANNTRLTQDSSSQENSGLILEKSIFQETHVDTSDDIKHEVIGKLYIKHPPRTF